MAVNKNFPNYTRSFVPAKVSEDPKYIYPKGPNRSGRRSEATKARRQAFDGLKSTQRFLVMMDKQKKQARLAKRAEANRVKSKARRDAKKKLHE
jgi:hypothetical protein